MTQDAARHEDAVRTLLAREAIRDLPLRYARALEHRDVDAMAELFSPNARFGAHGIGPDGARALMTTTMATSLFAVILVANHLIQLDDDGHAHGEVWARCYAMDDDGTFIEQLIKYVDRYERTDAGWRFLHRHHRLWYGAQAPSPFDQAPADWPEHQIGVGDLPLADGDFRGWWDERRTTTDGPIDD